MSPAKPSSDFAVEANEILEGMGRELLRLDEHHEPDPEVLNAVFRGAHSLKGLCGLFGQEHAADLAHHLEDVLDRLRLGKTKRTAKLLDAVNDAVELLGKLVQAGSAEEDLSPAMLERVDASVKRLTTLASAAHRAERDPLDRLTLEPNVRQTLTEYEEHRLREGLRKGYVVWRVTVAYPLMDFDVRLSELTARLKPLGETVSTLPSTQPVADEMIGFDLLVTSGAGEAALQGATEADGATLQLVPARKSKRRPPSSEGQQGFWTDADEVTASGADLPRGGAVVRPSIDPTLRSLSQTVRVDIERLDALMNAVGDLLVIKSNLTRLAETVLHDEAMRSPLRMSRALAQESRKLERRLDELQRGILGARMVPLAPLFDKLSRLVRKTAREAGKELEFTTEGGQVELDKLIVEELSDPLMHIIRNALDHGIETPSVRRQKGKPEQGRVTVSARTRGAHVILEVRDDGAGVNTRRVREVAVERGILSAPEAEELSERELHNLLFVPGFSTAGAVSTLSGRGVGLDVVKTNIAHLSGIIDVDSSKDEGTVFRLTLPVTLAIVRALLVQVSQRTYAVPLTSVVEILSVTHKEIRTVERREILTVHGQTLPLLRLSELFGHGPSLSQKPFVVVVGLAQDRLGLLVDELLGQQDIVTKPLGGRLEGIRGIGGATDLGDRRTVLVLDVGALLDDAQKLPVAPVASVH